MRSLCALFLFLTTLSAPLHAGKFEREIKQRWLGAWVLTEVETYSNCSGSYTANRVHGDLVHGQGFRFRTGELARVDRIDVKRTRIDVGLSLVEPRLASYSEGPFTLYREARCRLEIELGVPRERIKKKDAATVMDGMQAVLERHATQDSAEASSRWNRREREPYPEDYDRTLSELAAWRAERHNRTVQVQLDRARTLRDDIPEHLRSEIVYLTGFGQGLEKARAQDLDGCSRMIALDLRRDFRIAQDSDTATDDEKELASLGYTDGLRLVWSQILTRELPACFIDVPDLDGLSGEADRPEAGVLSTSATDPDRG